MQSQSGVVTSKGQLVIPVRLRRRLGIRRGTVVAFREEGRCLVIQPVTPEYVSSLRGSLKGSGEGLKGLLRERKNERHA